jgi:hypothetical protein
MDRNYLLMNREIRQNNEDALMMIWRLQQKGSFFLAEGRPITFKISYSVQFIEANDGFFLFNEMEVRNIFWH